MALFTRGACSSRSALYSESDTIHFSTPNVCQGVDTSGCEDEVDTSCNALITSSRGCERRSLRWLLNFRLDMVWDAETTRNLAELPPDNQGAYRGLLQCPT